MALRDQPYIPLYVQDFQTDEKLMECSAKATGVYIRLMCILHKSDDYGKILLRQKDKQTDQHIKNFAIRVAKYMPYSIDEIFDGISELISEGVLTVDGDVLFQKRMVKDNTISIERSKSGQKGGFATANKSAKHTAKTTANTEYENEIEIAVENIYNMYPAICPYKKRSTAKSKKDKVKIKRLLSEYTEQEIIKIISEYLKDCEPSKTYLKNFNTFLNNLPIEFLHQQPVKEQSLTSPKTSDTEITQWDIEHLPKEELFAKHKRLFPQGV